MLPSHHCEPVYQETAKQAGLRYTKDDIPGIRRKRYGKGFAYFAPDGARVTDKRTLERIRLLALPPAYRDVWICPHANGHLQATGIDDMGRKQYRYHPEWVLVRTTGKFERMASFIAALPRMRQRVEEDLEGRKLTRERILATLVCILERSYVRVGNDTYAERHDTYGLTTLRKRHLNLVGDRVEFSFKGKNLTPWHISLQDKRLARVLRQCEDVPGYRLFKYFDEEGRKQYVDSQDLNIYLKEISGEPFTAKDFRTFAACYEAFCLLRLVPLPESKAGRKRAANGVIREVAKRLGHTMAVCKKAYLHPMLLERWEDGTLHAWCATRRHEEERLFLQWWKAHFA